MNRVDIMNLVLTRDDASNRVAALKDKQGWLLEWEQALKTQPKSTASVTYEHRSITATDGRLPLPEKADAMPVLNSDRHKVVNEISGSNTTPESSATVLSQSSPPIRVPAHDIPLSFGNFQARESNGTVPTSASLMGRYIALRRNGYERIHLILTPSGVAAYVRAYGLTNETGEMLLRRLRRELSALGMRLAKLVVNGTTAWIQPEPQQAVAADEIIISRDQ